MGVSIYTVKRVLYHCVIRKQVDVLEYALGLALITVPLCLRLLTVNSMRIQNQKMRQANSQLRKITGELDAILERTAGGRAPTASVCAASFASVE